MREQGYNVLAYLHTVSYRNRAVNRCMYHFRGDTVREGQQYPCGRWEHTHSAGTVFLEDVEDIVHEAVHGLEI
jgi:hypothetical protein